MAVGVNRLSATAVKHAKPGRYADGGGLYLMVKPDARKTWVFRWRDRVTSKLRDHGLGPVWDVSLQEARERAAQCRRMIRDGTNPVDAKKSTIAAARLDLASRVTFEFCAKAYIAAHEATWRSKKHALQWRATLDTYAARLMPLPVADIDTGHVVAVLTPVWTVKTETATRLRQRIEAVVGWATVAGFRQGDNPARWRGHLQTMLASPSHAKKVEHMAALPHARIGGFMAELRSRAGVGARALELQILAAMRPGAVAAARFDEVDLQAATWTIPGDRMKTRLGKELERTHVVPLSREAVRLIQSLERSGPYMFPGAKQGTHVVTATMLKAARVIDATVDAHGFRSCFRDWAADCTDYPRDLAEAALAHVLQSKTEAAYQRSKLVERRRALMQDWADRCSRADDMQAQVIAISSVKTKRQENAR